MSETKEKKLTEKERIFCREYIYDWNASRAAKKAGYSEKTAPEIGYENLKKPHIQKEIERVQKDLEKIAGISRKKVLEEYMKLAFSSIANLHNTWIERKEFEELTDDQKAGISEISTQVRTVYEYNPESDKKEPIRVEFVKIKLYDKQKALESINKMLGYNEADKIDHTTKGEKIQDLSHLTTEELIKRGKLMQNIEKNEND